MADMCDISIIPYLNHNHPERKYIRCLAGRLTGRQDLGRGPPEGVAVIVRDAY